MSHYVSKQTLRSILRRMPRRSWGLHNGRLVDFQGHLIARPARQNCAETDLLVLAPDIALAYVELAQEYEELREERDDLQEKLAKATSVSEDRKIA